MTTVKNDSIPDDITNTREITIRDREHARELKLSVHVKSCDKGVVHLVYAAALPTK